MIMSIMPQSGQASIPTNMQQLRDLVVSIRTGDAAVSLGSKALTFLGRLVERPEVVAVRTITELGQLLDVNPSTLSRLVRSLGYSGFSGFQRGFCDEVTNSRDRFYNGQALRLLDQQTTDASFDDYLNAAAAVLTRAGQFRVYGIRQFNAVAANTHTTFFIPHQSSFISNSIGAYIVFCESLINLVAKELGPIALASLERQE